MAEVGVEWVTCCLGCGCFAGVQVAGDLGSCCCAVGDCDVVDQCAFFGGCEVVDVF